MITFLLILWLITLIGAGVLALILAYTKQASERDAAIYKEAIAKSRAEVLEMTREVERVKGKVDETRKKNIESVSVGDSGDVGRSLGILQNLAGRSKRTGSTPGD